jgi:hypothetical protein
MFRLIIKPIKTRVLHIGKNDMSKPFWVEPQGLEAQYICLSYCWGGAEFLKLTTGNLEACRHGIFIGDLPTCFQDAIEIARYFNIQYIWIDALCILQDNKEDWDIQGSKLAEIYQLS